MLRMPLLRVPLLFARNVTKLPQTCSHIQSWTRESALKVTSLSGGSKLPLFWQLSRQFSVNHRHKKMIKLAKGYRGRTNCFKMAKHRVIKARQYAYRDRKVKKREFRKLWILRINAGSRMYGLPYRVLIHRLQASNISLDRKILADLAVTEPLTFKSIVEIAKQSIQKQI